ncbi:MAG: acylneuraminate cytidylyltransferase family protein [Actinomycetota bacterium]
MTIDGIVAFVPMRHSSERVPGKNYRDFNGRPLFHHVVSTLLDVPQIDTVVIDTDSPTIEEQCAQHFPTVRCIPRPERLLGGEVPMTDVLAYDASQFPASWYLQTHSTNPLLTAATVQRAIEALDASIDTHDSLFTVTRLQTRLYDQQGNPINHDPSELLRTQDLPPVYEENSNVYVFPDHLIAAGQRIGDRPMLFEVDPLEAVDIDEEHDFVIAELLHKMRSAQ